MLKRGVNDVHFYKIWLAELTADIHESMPVVEKIYVETTFSWNSLAAAKYSTGNQSYM